MGPGASWDIFLCLPVATFAIGSTLQAPNPFQLGLGSHKPCLFLGSQLLAVPRAPVAHAGGYTSVECWLH